MAILAGLSSIESDGSISFCFNMLCRLDESLAASGDRLSA